MIFTALTHPANAYVKRTKKKIKKKHKPAWHPSQRKFKTNQKYIKRGYSRYAIQGTLSLAHNEWLCFFFSFFLKQDVEKVPLRLFFAVKCQLCRYFCSHPPPHRRWNRRNNNKLFNEGNWTEWEKKEMCLQRNNNCIRSNCLGREYSIWCWPWH